VKAARGASPDDLTLSFGAYVFSRNFSTSVLLLSLLLLLALLVPSRLSLFLIHHTSESELYYHI
jgi:hypothetical protein